MWLRTLVSKCIVREGGVGARSDVEGEPSGGGASIASGACTLRAAWPDLWRGLLVWSGARVTLCHWACTPAVRMPGAEAVMPMHCRGIIWSGSCPTKGSQGCLALEPNLGALGRNRPPNAASMVSSTHRQAQLCAGQQHLAGAAAAGKLAGVIARSGTAPRPSTRRPLL